MRKKTNARNAFAKAVALGAVFFLGCAATIPRRGAKPDCNTDFSLVFKRASAETISTAYQKAAMKGMLKRHAAEMENPENKKTLDDFFRNFDYLRKADIRKKLRETDRMIDAFVSYRFDSEVYNIDDHWATPLETVSRGTGDCEDFAILKLFTLRYLGVSAQDLRLFTVEKGDNGHAVLLANTPGEPVILDNTDKNGKGRLIPGNCYKTNSGYTTTNGLYKIEP